MGSPCYSGTVSALKMVVGFWQGFGGRKINDLWSLFHNSFVSWPDFIGMLSLQNKISVIIHANQVLGECLLRDYPDFMVLAFSSFNKPPLFHSMESFKGIPPVRDIKILTKVRTPILRQVENIEVKVLRRELTENECTGENQDAGKGLAHASILNCKDELIFKPCSLMQMYPVILIPPSKLNQVTHTSRSFDLVPQTAKGRLRNHVSDFFLQFIDIYARIYEVSLMVNKALLKFCRSKELTKQLLLDNARFVVANLIGTIGFAHFLSLTSVETVFSVYRKEGKKQVFTDLSSLYNSVVTTIRLRGRTDGIDPSIVAHGIVFTRRALIWIVENTPEEKPRLQDCKEAFKVVKKLLYCLGRSTKYRACGGIRSTMSSGPCFFPSGTNKPVGILVDRVTLMTQLLCNITVGASLTDMLASHELLAYADRMVANREVSLTVIKLLSCNNVGDNVNE
ncbi:hypothetical protein NC651_022152 [Populus alba x Populus x berolinensis]|nr:hypothetical protein NC651_022152 [Populus alba x Populus x berolinensis]